MPPTPNLPNLEGGYTLRPVSKAILPMVIEAYSEDPESAKAALPWLRSEEDITRQLADMLHDLEHLSNADRVHFWSIHDQQNTFIGLIGLGDEMQLLHRITILVTGFVKDSEIEKLLQMQLMLFLDGSNREVRRSELKSVFTHEMRLVSLLLNGSVSAGTAKSLTNSSALS